MLFRQIPGIPNYEINELGEIKVISSGKTRKTIVTKQGYEAVVLFINKQRKYYFVHRLVALTWLGIPNSNLIVNHKDGNKLNNSVKNLEWATYKENNIHALDNMLNPNTNKTTLIDHDLEIEIGFRSIKSLCKYLKMHSNSLVPLIKNSYENKILDRYTVVINDISVLHEKSNVINFGKEVHVFDEVTNKLISYPSLGIAAYHTCIKSIFTLHKYAFIHVNGYYVSFDKKSLPTSTNSDKNKIMSEREHYVNEKYVKRDFTYKLFNYYTGKEIEFDSVSAVCNYINNSTSKFKTTLDEISNAICKGSIENRSGLILGYGIQSSKRVFPWFAYSEEAVISSSNKMKNNGVYRVTSSEFEITIVGKTKLVYFINSISDKYGIQKINTKHLSNFKVSEFNHFDIKINRLTHPIKIKT